MQKLITMMNVIEEKSPKIIKCPICGKQHFKRTGLRNGLHYEREPLQLLCGHISAFLNIIEYDIDSLPTNEEIYLVATLYLPRLQLKGTSNIIEVENFLVERKPDYVIKCDINDDLFKWYFFFKKEDIGIMD